jgi:hypothetical protein
MAALLMPACATSRDALYSGGPREENLLSLVPSGAEVLADIDMVQLRTWPTTPRLVSLLPDPVRERLNWAGAGSSSDVDGVLVALYSVGPTTTHGIVLIRGALPENSIAAMWPGKSDRMYRDLKVWEHGGEAFSILNPHLAVWGSQAEVLRTIDVWKGESDSILVGQLDKRVREALAKSPTAKTGRPAIRSGAILSPALLAELKREKILLDDVSWVALSLALGDGFDVGAIWQTIGLAEAQDQVGALRGRIDWWKNRLSVRALGLANIFDNVILVPKGGEVHLAYRVPGARLDSALTPLEVWRKKHEGAQ